MTINIGLRLCPSWKFWLGLTPLQGNTKELLIFYAGAALYANRILTRTSLSPLPLPPDSSRCQSANPASLSPDSCVQAHSGQRSFHPVVAGRDNGMINLLKDNGSRRPLGGRRGRRGRSQSSNLIRKPRTRTEFLPFLFVCPSLIQLSD